MCWAKGPSDMVHARSTAVLGIYVVTKIHIGTSAEEQVQACTPRALITLYGGGGNANNLRGCMSMWTDTASEARLARRDAVAAHSQVVVLLASVFDQVSWDIRRPVELASVPK